MSKSKTKADMGIARRLYGLRKKAGLSPSEVAEGIGYKCGNSVEQWEAGCRSANTKVIRLYAAFFGVNIWWLLNGGRKDPRNPKIPDPTPAELALAAAINLLIADTTMRLTASLQKSAESISHSFEVLRSNKAILELIAKEAENLKTTVGVESSK